MDPYLEHPSIWHDVHLGLLGRTCIALTAKIAPRYYIAVEGHSVEPASEDEIPERYLEIRDAQTHQVVTVIEILSPSNKTPGEGRDTYEAKRHQVLSSLTHLVEIDLIRAGKPMPMSHLPSSHYRILVSRQWERFKAKLYPFNLNEPIPEIPIPLRKGETEPTLALGELLGQVYDEVRYDLRIDYALEPKPPLDSASAAWSRQLLAQSGRH